MKKELTKEVKIKIPILPNFILTEGEDVIPISKFSTEELQKIGEEWTKLLIERAKNK